MVWSCKIVPQGFRCVFPKENRTSMANLCQVRKRIVYTNFQMFRCNFICNLYSLCHGFCQNDFAAIVNGCSGNFCPREQRNLPFQFRRNGICQSCTVCYQYSACHGVMFCLRKHIRRNNLRITGIIPQNQDFAGTCNHINGNPTKNLFFGFCHKGIARSYNLIHTRHTFCTISQCTNSLCAADFKDTVYASNFCRN